MKINYFLLFIAFAISALIGYGFWAGTENLYLVIGSTFVSFITLSGILAVSFGRGSGNLKALSVCFFAFSLIEHLIFDFAGFRQAPYIIITGILVLVYAMIFYLVAKN